MSAASPKTAVAPGKDPRQKCVRKTKGLKPGKVSWIHGTKLTFFESRMEAWKQATEGGFTTLTQFYSDIADLYLLKYRYGFKDDDDLEDGVPDPIESNARKGALQAWKVEVQRTQDLELPAPSEIKICNAVTKEVFAEETEEFQAELLVGVEAESLKNTGYHLEPLAAVIREKFGMNCSILLCGPVGNRGGTIEVWSVHAGTTRGVGPKKWYEFNCAEYEVTERSMVKFSARCFMEEDCCAHVIQGNTGDTVSQAAPLQPGQAGPSQPPQVPPLQPLQVPLLQPPQSAATTSTNLGEMTTTPSPQENLGERNTAPLPQDILQSPSNGEERNGEEGAGGVEGQADEPQHAVWMRSDKGKRTSEMCNVFGVFMLGKKWGVEWEDCMDAWLDLEAGCDYRNNGRKLGTNKCLQEVHQFI
ncbi:hypothetical protein B0H17DRAFT_1195312 [Mycena rosella]|uniref:Uncharacterized protein n=1 Tax=Mycena rosella TaxID=1033263 RepID=A0AAD7DWM7_MYCRO|nr:hypothetical protein B0H17DRAFT_1195312 [Mycena rosella]